MSNEKELSDLVGPETSLPLNRFQPPPMKSEKELTEAWKKADAFFPGFNNDGSRWPDFSSLVMGHRLYETASFRTYRPDRLTFLSAFSLPFPHIQSLHVGLGGAQVTAAKRPSQPSE
ncbi:hypothetical protein LR48_Vigan233s002500 [Vigna angularis]|uniref:Uncharacterized protein n=1 Tax=Phaseolus angularis TaxID=3914 RepID=A0A0L9T6F4_PHAAN|nr:hypothetical protein LR48_Vigan233s002500 [Vigna angularis]